jgi:hypothetical protein
VAPRPWLWASRAGPSSQLPSPALCEDKGDAQPPLTSPLHSHPLLHSPFPRAELARALPWPPPARNRGQRRRQPPPSCPQPPSRATTSSRVFNRSPDQLQLANRESSSTSGRSAIVEVELHPDLPRPLQRLHCPRGEHPKPRDPFPLLPHARSCLPASSRSGRRGHGRSRRHGPSQPAILAPIDAPRPPRSVPPNAASSGSPCWSAASPPWHGRRRRAQAVACATGSWVPPAGLAPKFHVNLKTENNPPLIVLLIKPVRKKNYTGMDWC